MNGGTSRTRHQAKGDQLEKQISRLHIGTDVDCLSDPDDLSALRKKIETGILRPRAAISEDLLHEVQWPWTYEPTFSDVFELPELSTKHAVKFIRKGLQGQITGYTEVVDHADRLLPENSSSFRRAPASKNAFVRGKGSFFPFLPGGLDLKKEALVAESLPGLDSNVQLDMSTDGFLQRAPNMPKVHLESVGMDLGIAADPAKWHLPQLQSELSASDSIKPAAKPTEDAQINTISEVDEYLPADFAMIQAIPAPKPAPRTKDKIWAHMVDVNRDMSNFRELVPDLAFKHPFELDTFQKEAVYHLEQAESVFVAAHTSAGKTVVAEYAIALASKHMTRAIYTSPIKALSNQKYRDFRHTFESVGILTGDVQLNPEASCLIMTTEILRSMLYRGADLIRDVEFVIFDEVHYVNDQERGVVWEEVIIMLPEHVTIIMLSATVPNTFEFANWVGRTKQKDIYVISTLKRPVPLEHHLYANKKLFKIVDANKQWNSIGHKEASQALVRNKEAKPVVAPTGRGRGANRGSGQRGAMTNGRGRGQAQPFVRGGTMKTMERHDKNIWIHLVNHLKEKKLLPCVIFVFSKKRCEENASILSNIDLTNAVEKSQIHVTIEKALSRLKLEDRTLPQIVRMRELLSRGIAVHHGGLLPIVKEMVEILFSRTLVKTLFATETFAMGVNMPAKSVVFSGIRKHDGHGFRDLTPGEYTQMAGRAGRRGLDPTGTVIIVCGEETPDTSTLSHMLLGQPFKLLSQFRLTYNMILNLLRVETLKIEEMIRRSFSENASQTLLPEQQKIVSSTQQKLDALRKEHAANTNTNVRDCHASCVLYTQQSRLLIDQAIEVYGRKCFGPGRAVLVQTEDMSRSLAIILGESATSTARQRAFSMLICKSTSSGKRATDLIPFLPVFRKFTPATFATDGKFTLDIFPASSIEHVTQTSLKIDPTAIRRRVKSAWDALKQDIDSLFNDVSSASFDEFDWTVIKSMTIRDTLATRSSYSATAQDNGAEGIEGFVQMYTLYHEQYLLQSTLDSLRLAISNQNLELVPDYEQRMAVLYDLGFIDGYTPHHTTADSGPGAAASSSSSGSVANVTLKGRVACEINSAHELLLSELILENAFADFECAEVVALLSCFVFDERTDSTPNLTPRLVSGRALIVATAKRVNEVQERHQVLDRTGSSDAFDTGDSNGNGNGSAGAGAGAGAGGGGGGSSRFGLMEVCYEWAQGTSFAAITDMTDVLEGTIVRCIVRLDEVLRECQSAARTIGDTAMYTKMERCRELIKRDVVFSASLFW